MRILNVLHVAEEKPHAELKRATRPLGNLPSKILSYMYAFVDDATSNVILRTGSMESSILDNLQALDDILATRLDFTPDRYRCIPFRQ